jgi:hypothetical protein
VAHAFGIGDHYRDAVQGRSQDLIDFGALEGAADHLAKTYAAADPFPHVVVDDALALDLFADGADFPDFEWESWHRSPERYQLEKVTCKEWELIPGPFLEVINEMSRPRFLRWLEQVSGIPGLIPDPYLEGGGLHMSGPGGILAPHTDFHLHPRLGTFRRLNLILYLEPTWSERDGGCLELRDRDGVTKHVVAPNYGRMVIFETSDHSFHGFPEPIAEGRRRRSIALYYYTATDGEGFGGLLSTTDWREHGSGGAVHRLRVGLYRLLVNVARCFTFAAHLVNPNQGAATIRYARRHRNR